MEAILDYSILKKSLEKGTATSHIAAIGYASSVEGLKREELLTFITDWCIHSVHGDSKGTLRAANDMLANRTQKETSPINFF